MSHWSEQLHRRMTFAESFIWTGALLVVSSACAAATLLSPAPREVAGTAAPQAAIMIELAPVPEAVDTTHQAVTEDRADAADRADPAEIRTQAEPLPPQESVIEEAKTTPELPRPVSFAPDMKPATVPPTEAAPPERPDPLEEQMLAALENVAVPLPVARPASATPTLPKARDAQKPKSSTKDRQTAKREPAATAARKPAALAKASTRNAAEKTVISSTASKGDSNRWKSRVVAHLERRKRYPASARARGEEGTVLVAFRIDGGGRVLSASLARSSGHRALDEAALAMVERASPVPAPPAGTGTTLTAPVRFVRR